MRLREVKADMIGYTNELLAKAIDQHKLDMPLTAEDKERFVNFLVSEGYLDRPTHDLQGVRERGPGDPYDFSALLQSGFGNRMRSVPSMRRHRRRRCSSRSAAWTSSRRASSARSARRRSRFDAEVQSIHQNDTRREGRLLDTKSGQEDRAHRRLLVVCLPLPILAEPRRQPVARDDGRR